MSLKSCCKRQSSCCSTVLISTLYHWSTLNTMQGQTLETWACEWCRYLLVLEDEEIKLLLQAFQLSTTACEAHPNCAVLSTQMPARLLGMGFASLLQVCIPSPMIWRFHLAI